MADLTVVANSIIGWSIITGIGQAETFPDAGYWNADLNVKTLPSNSVIGGTGALSASLVSRLINAASIAGAGELSGDARAGVVIVNPSIKGVGEISGIGYAIPIITSGYAGSPWVIWSKIGSADFTIDKSNVAGKRPMPWAGWVYQIKKLRDSVIVYGENGIVQMKPSGVVWGLTQILGAGLLSKNAVCGTEEIHWFVSKGTILYELSSDGLKKLGYQKHLETLTKPTIMVYDEKKRIVYICDGHVDSHLYVPGEGLGCSPYDSLTGMGQKDGFFMVVASTPQGNLGLGCQTDILDFGTRKEKTISRIEFGEVGVSAQIDYAHSTGQMESTPWVNSDKKGVVYIHASGVDFQISWKGGTKYPEINIYYSIQEDA